MRYTFTVLIGLLIWLVPLGANATSVNLSFTENCVDAQHLIFQLRLNEANERLTTERKVHPDNVVTDYLEVTYYMLSFVTSEKNSDYEQFKSIKDRATDRISDLDAHDGYRDFLLEEIYFYSSVVEGKKGHALSAANDVRNAYKYGSKVLDNYPSLQAAQKTIGLLNSGFGSLPNTYQKLVTFFGYETSMDKGIAQLREFINQKDCPEHLKLLQKEAEFYLGSVYLYLKNDKTTAWKMVEQLTSDYKSNPLSAFARVNFADKCKKNDVVIETIAQLPTSAQYATIPFLSFMMGKAKLQRNDVDADEYLLNFIQTQQGNSYVKSCYQKLAWHALIHGKPNQYFHYLNQVTQNGNGQLEEDEQAQKEANAGVVPNVGLLKTRLLFDGGYYETALSVIRPMRVRNFDTDLLKTEYLYRKARIYDALNEFELARAFYMGAMERGKNLSNYYASYSSLYLAELYERNNNKAKAEEYFKKSTSFSSNKEYKKSIEHRAKNGLARIK